MIKNERKVRRNSNKNLGFCLLTFLFFIYTIALICINLQKHFIYLQGNTFIAVQFTNRMIKMNEILQYPAGRGFSTSSPNCHKEIFHSAEAAYFCWLCYYLKFEHYWMHNCQFGAI